MLACSPRSRRSIRSKKSASEERETPDLKPPYRLPRPRGSRSDRRVAICDRARRARRRRTRPQPGHLPHRHTWANNCDTLDRALTFADPVEAEHHLAALTPRPMVLLRYLAGAQAEADLREAQQIDGKATL